MIKEINTRIKWKRDTEANWIANNPILLDGEFIIVDMDTGEIRFKVGDGGKVYTQLPFQDEVIRDLVDTKQEKIEGKQLSTNDYTDEDMNKLSMIEDNAEENVIENIKSSTLNVSTNADKTVELDFQWGEFK